MVATLRYFEVGQVFRSRQHARDCRNLSRRVEGVDLDIGGRSGFVQAGGFEYLTQFVGTKNKIDFGNLLEKLISIALSETTRNDQLPATALLLQFCHLQDCIDRLLLGTVDKAAGVDDDHVGRLPTGRDLIPMLRQGSKHHFAVDQVLRTAQADKSNLGSVVFFRFRHYVKEWGRTPLIYLC